MFTRTLALAVLFAAPAHATDACVVGDHAGIDPADAQTVAMLVCEELRTLGVDVGPPGEKAGVPAWRVTLRKLGDGTLLSLSKEDAAGGIQRTERLHINDLNQAPKAARRLANAVKTGAPVEDTQRVANMVEGETQVYEKKPGEFLWKVGILGGYIPGSDTGVAYGFDVGAFYETPRWSIGSDLRTLFATGDRPENQSDDKDDYGYHDYDEENEATAFAWGVGARWFFTDRDISPYIGGGLTLNAIDVEADDFRGDDGGLGAYAQVGVEMFRLHGSRFTVDLRVDTPFFEIEGWDGGSGYVVPVSVGVSYAW